MIRHMCLIVAACSISAVAHATPAYVECPFRDGNGQPFPINITFDEAAGNVTINTPATGFVKRYNGVFRPTEVLFGDGTAQYRMDRINLVLTREIVMLHATEEAHCKLQKPPTTRAF